MKHEYEKPELKWVSFQSQDMLMAGVLDGSAGYDDKPPIGQNLDDKSSYQIGE